MLTALVVAWLHAGASPHQVATYVDPKSKEELLVLELNGTAQVFYAPKAGALRKELKVSGDVAGRIVTVTFPDPAKKYVLEWTSAHDRVKCSNPDGSQQTFERTDLDRPPFRTPSAAVRALYARFAPEAQFTHALNLEGVDHDERAIYLTPNLASAMEAMLAGCEPGTVCGPDYDVLYDAQDLSVSQLKVSEGDKANVVTVTFENGREKRSIKLKTERVADGWKVSDVQYEKNRSLLKMLETAIAMQKK